MTRARATALALAIAITWGLAAGCAPRIGPNGVTSDDAIIYVKSKRARRAGLIDGRFIAPLDALGGGVAVEPGSHQLELRHEDYFSSYLELPLARAERKKVALDLAPILP